MAAVAAVIDDVGLDGVMDDVIDGLRRTFAAHDETTTVTLARAGFAYDKPDLGLVEWMPTMEVGGRVSIKTVGYHPTNPVQRGLPSVMATTSLHDTTSGRLLALVDATFLTAIRTGAASAVATELLAIDAPLDVVAVGAGAQAVSQLHAISRVRPLRAIAVFDPQADVAASLARRLPASLAGVSIEILDDDTLAAAAARADLIITATTVDPGAGPVLPDLDQHRPHLHVNAVGADFPGKLELSRALVDRAVVIPDHRAQCLAEGECQTLDDDAVGPDLFRLVASPRPELADVLTVFDSTGWALEDLVAAEVLLRHADRLDVGFAAEIQPEPGDPYDPYALR